MRVYVLGSGSSGNALLVESCGTRVLIEAGIAPKVVASRLAELGVALEPGSLDGIVASHEHGDHFGHAARLAAAFAAPLFLHRGLEVRSASSTSPSSPERSGALDVRVYDVGAAVSVGALTITTALVPHDAAQVAIRVDDGVRALGVATDIGRVTSSLVALLAGCDAAIVEANHCAEMLAFSDYPESVKRRIGGGWGHLSNAQTAELAARLVGSRLSRLWLAHLSEANNSPRRALEVVGERARRIEVDVLPASSAVALDVSGSRPYQLGLPF